MGNTGNSNNINSGSYRMVIIPEESIDTIREKLGKDFVWKQDDTTNQLMLMEKSKSGGSFSEGFGKDMPELAKEWYKGNLKNRWDD